MCAGDYLSLNPSPDTTDGKRLTNHVATVSSYCFGQNSPTRYWSTCDWLLAVGTIQLRRCVFLRAVLPIVVGVSLSQESWDGIHGHPVPSAGRASKTRPRGGGA